MSTTWNITSTPHIESCDLASSASGGGVAIGTRLRGPAATPLRRPTSTHAAEARATRGFFVGFIISLVLISIPVKNFAYIAPVAYLLLQAAYGNGKLLFRVSAVAAAALVVSSLSLLSDSTRMNVNVPGMFVALFTFLPLMIAVCHPRLLSFSDDTFHRMQTTCAWFVIIQSMIGFGQFAMSRNPDTVCGTFGLLDFRSTTVTIAQVYFTFTIFSMLLFMFLNARRRLIQVAIGLGLFSCVLAQSGHQTIFFVCSLTAFGMFRLTRPKTTIALLLVVAAIVAMVQCFYPETYGLATAWREKVLDVNSPKRMAVEGGMSVLENSKNLWFGTGLGQYSSRAALITSNEYLSSELPAMLVGKSDYYTRFIEPANYRFQEYGEGSAISKPYCSLLSIVVETGLVGTILVGIAGVAQLIRNFGFMRSRDPWVSLAGMFANVGLVFFVLCCTIENYAEFAQALLLPILIYVAATSKAGLRQLGQTGSQELRTLRKAVP